MCHQLILYSTKNLQYSWSRKSDFFLYKVAVFVWRTRQLFLMYKIYFLYSSHVMLIKPCMFLQKLKIKTLTVQLDSPGGGKGSLDADQVSWGHLGVNGQCVNRTLGDDCGGKDNAADQSQVLSLLVCDTYQLSSQDACAELSRARGH